jgi:NADH-quinone oxidoreductase subunit D
MEKMAERDVYAQIIHLTDRMDYLSAMHCNWSYCLAVERLCGFQVPERAEYIRVIIGELNRLSSHLLWYGAYGMDLGAVTAFFYGFREREDIVDLFETVCGARLTYNYYCIGGVRHDITEDFVPRVKAICEMLKPKIDEYEGLVTGNVIFQQRTKGIGVLTKEKAVSYGCGGPVLRGSGVKFDLRKDDPYSIYDRFQFDIPTGTVGDCYDRYAVRMEEMRQSIRILEQAIDKIPEGPIVGKVPRVIRATAGEVYSRLETSRGDMGIYLVSDGNTKSYRTKFRSACFSNLSALPEISVGWKVADVVSILGSFDVVIPDVDR